MAKEIEFENGTPVEAHPDDCDCERCSQERECDNEDADK